MMLDELENVNGYRTHLGVGDATVIQQLQQHVHDVGVRLLHLVKQHHRMWVPPAGSRQYIAMSEC